MPSEEDMLTRKVSVFRNGRSRAIRIPREFDHFGDAVMLRQDGAVVVIEPMPKPGSLAELLATMEPCEDEFPEIEDLPAEPVEI
jgi:antitoxin VapB